MPLALAGVLGGALLVMRWPWATRLAGLVLLWPVLSWQPPRPAPGAFDVMALDVGQGSAVLVRTARHSLLVDTGPRWGNDSDAGERIVGGRLRRFPQSGVRRKRAIMAAKGVEAPLNQHEMHRFFGADGEPVGYEVAGKVGAKASGNVEGEVNCRKFDMRESMQHRDLARQ